MALSVADVEPVQSSEQSRERRMSRRADNPEERHEETEEAEDLLFGPESVRQDKRGRHGFLRKPCLHIGLVRHALSRARAAGAVSHCRSKQKRVLSTMDCDGLLEE